MVLHGSASGGKHDTPSKKSSMASSSAGGRRRASMDASAGKESAAGPVEWEAGEELPSHSAELGFPPAPASAERRSVGFEATSFSPISTPNNNNGAMRRLESLGKAKSVKYMSTRHENMMGQQARMAAKAKNTTELPPEELQAVVKIFQQALKDVQDKVQGQAEAAEEAAAGKGWVKKSLSRRGSTVTGEISRAPSRSGESRDPSRNGERGGSMEIGSRAGSRAGGMSRAASRGQAADSFRVSTADSRQSENSAGFSEEARATEALFQVFGFFSSDDDGITTKHDSSMNVHEFLGFCDSFGLVPGAMSKKAAIMLFKEVNTKGGVSDYDSHEFSQSEFHRAMEIVAKRMGLGDVVELVLPSNEHKEGFGKSGGGLVADVRSLSELTVRNMQQLLKMFRKRTSDTSAEPELDQEVFVKEFSAILKAPEREMLLLFMKIDVNSDGKVSWNEFSSFVLDIHSREGSISAGDSVFDGTLTFEADETFHHDNSIVFLLHVQKHSLFVSVTGEGIVRTWFTSNGHAVGKPTPKSVNAIPARSVVISVAVLSKSMMLAIGSDDFKIRFFDVASLRHELTMDCSGHWPMTLEAFLFPEESDEGKKLGESSKRATETAGSGAEVEMKGWEGWLVWGDDWGELHFVPEAQLMQYRTPHEVVPVFRSSLRGLWDIKVFHAADGAVGAAQAVWCSALRFIPDIGYSGVVVVAGTNGQTAVISVEQKLIFHYCFHHRLAVKALAWCGRQNNLLASAGLDRTIHLWRPEAQRGGKPVVSGALNGHNSGVVDLCFHEARDVLFSLDSQGGVLVWDLASRTLVSRLNSISQNNFDIQRKVARMIVNQRSRHLVTATNHLRLQGVRPLDLRDESEKLVAHTGDVSVVLYNASFDFILSADRGGFVSTWSLATGAQIFKFVCVEVEGTLGIPQVECGGFDLSERRLIIGWSQGSVQVYNFSNGTLLHILITDSPSPVTCVRQVTYVRGKEVHINFMAALSDGSVAIWPNSLHEAECRAHRTMVVPDWLGGEDYAEVPVTCVGFGQCRWGVQDVLVTGRKDGAALIWDMQTSFLRKQDMAVQVAELGTPLVTMCFMNRLAHICLVSDAAAYIHFVDVEVGVKVGTLQGRRSNVQYLPTSAMTVDYTDSFLFAGDTQGMMQVWDISQVFDSTEQLDLSLCIDVFYWRQHHNTITGIVHLSKMNLLVTSGLDAETACQLSTLTGKRVGRFGHERWTSMQIADTIHRGEAQLAEGATANKSLVPHAKRVGTALSGTTSYMQRLRNRKLKEEGAQEGTHEHDDQEEEEAEGEDAESEVDHGQRGQFSLRIMALQLTLPPDRKSKSMAVVKIEMPGQLMRQARPGEQCLYFIDSVTHLLRMTVWDSGAGAGGGEEFVGQREEVLSDLATGQDVWLPLQRRDGTESAKLGTLIVRCEFMAVRSELSSARRPTTTHQHIRNIIARQGVNLPPPPKRFSDKEGGGAQEREVAAASGSITALATPRWQTRDYRFLSVYHLQESNVLVSLVDHEEDNDEKLMRPGGHVAAYDWSGSASAANARDKDGASSFAPNKKNQIQHRFARDTFAGKIERSIDAAYQTEFGAERLYTQDANAAMAKMQRNRRPSGSPGRGELGLALNDHKIKVAQSIRFLARAQMVTDQHHKSDEEKARKDQLGIHLTPGKGRRESQAAAEAGSVRTPRDTVRPNAKFRAVMRIIPKKNTELSSSGAKTARGSRSPLAHTGSKSPSMGSRGLPKLKLDSLSERPSAAHTAR